MKSGIKAIESLQHLAMGSRRGMLLSAALMVSSRDSSEKQVGLLVSNRTRRNPKEKQKPLQRLKAR